MGQERGRGMQTALELGKQGEDRPVGSVLSSPCLPVAGEDLTWSAGPVCVCVSSSEAFNSS